VEAIGNLSGKAQYTDIIDYVKKKYGDINDNTIRCQIIACTVNNPSRIYYGNRKPRIANSQNDFLFYVDRGLVELYDPDKHGKWEIRKDETGKLIVAQTGFDELPEVEQEPIAEEQAFPVERHLRDFIVENISTIKVDNAKLRLYTDENGRDGVEYPTEVGPIDILAIDEKGDFVVFELKLSRGNDGAFGQLSRYVGWVEINIAKNKKVKGIIIAKSMDDKLRYAASISPKIKLFEYDLMFKIRQADVRVASTS
jgi:hypothetical protein